MAGDSSIDVAAAAYDIIRFNRHFRRTSCCNIMTLRWRCFFFDQSFGSGFKLLNVLPAFGLGIHRFLQLRWRRPGAGSVKLGVIGCNGGGSTTVRRGITYPAPLPCAFGGCVSNLTQVAAILLKCHDRPRKHQRDGRELILMFFCLPSAATGGTITSATSTIVAH